jgi:hypothetical protein
LVLGLGSWIGVADAQTSTGQPGTGQPSRTDAEIRSVRTANLSGADQLREATQAVDLETTMRRSVSDLLDHARQERDIIKVNCLNDKLTQIDVTLRSSREHQELLQTAVSINNDGQRNHEFTLLTIFRSHAEGLVTEAHQCVGEDTGTFDHGTIVTTRVDPNIPEQDTTVLNPDSLVPDRPLVASPVM